MVIIGKQTIVFDEFTCQYLAIITPVLTCREAGQCWRATHAPDE